MEILSKGLNLYGQCGRQEGFFQYKFLKWGKVNFEGIYSFNNKQSENVNIYCFPFTTLLISLNLINS